MKFKVGDRVVEKSSKLKAKVISISSVFDDAFIIKLKSSGIIDTFRMSIFELDKEYYRDQKINEILSEE